jgi:hypothetical protein
MAGSFRSRTSYREARKRRSRRPGSDKSRSVPGKASRTFQLRRFGRAAPPVSPRRSSAVSCGAGGFGCGGGRSPSASSQTSTSICEKPRSTLLRRRDRSGRVRQRRRLCTGGHQRRRSWSHPLRSPPGVGPRRRTGRRADCSRSRARLRWDSRRLARAASDARQLQRDLPPAGRAAATASSLNDVSAIRHRLGGSAKRFYPAPSFLQVAVVTRLHDEPC